MSTILTPVNREATLNQVVASFQGQQEQAGLQLFNTLSDSDKNTIYGHLWEVAGMPQAFDGKRSFQGDYPVAQKIEAVNLFLKLRCGKTVPTAFGATLGQPSLLAEIATKFEAGNEDEAIKLCGRLPLEKQHQLHGLLWKMAGSPANVALNFGERVLFNLETVKMAAAKKAEAVRALILMQPKLVVDLKKTSDPQALIAVWQETEAAIKQGFYMSPAGVKRSLMPSLETCRKITYLYRDGNVVKVHPGVHNTVLMVISEDCLKVAMDQRKRGLNPLVMNLGNNDHPGGGYLKGWCAQEEYLFHTTTLSTALDPNGNQQNSSHYPMHKKSGTPGPAIYTRDVLVLRDRQYQFLEEPVAVAVGTVAAYNLKPDQLDLKDPKNPRIKDSTIVAHTREKIRTLLYMAYEQGHDALVLGAMGCGAFGNPPQQIAELFRDVIDKEYPKAFKEIIFAVFDDFSALGNKPHNPEGNFKPFKRVIEGK